ncbi:alpha/beta hydrolase [Oleiharenicola sp. Vm1]|uniref:alpha/beta hydrolase n=1 Tax=Oleiharenicola sp. Vm1 TaxID=3398393 RepID=UPI0039F5B96B
MLPVLLGVLLLALAYAASFTLHHAPQRSWIWKVALAVGEYGVWFVPLALGLGAIAGVATDGATRVVLLGLSAGATAGLLRPVASAARIGARLPAALRAAFGASAVAPAPAFSLARLFLHAAPPRAARETHVFARPEGVELSLDFYRARGAGADGAPCLVVVHGGGWDGGDREQIPEWNHRWAARGCAVAAVSYRLAPRFVWPAQRDDVRAALAWLKAHARALGIDAGRFVLLGRSAGGQIATAVAYGTRDPAIRGVISFYAPQDMEFAWGVSREDDALNSANLMRQYLGGPPDTTERRARYADASAQAMIGPATPPTLLLHGAPDTLVWHRHSERLAAALQAAGVPHHFLSLPWATHAFDFNPDGPGGQLTDCAVGSFLRATVGAG